MAVPTLSKELMQPLHRVTPPEVVVDVNASLPDPDRAELPVDRLGPTLEGLGFGRDEGAARPRRLAGCFQGLALEFGPYE